MTINIIGAGFGRTGTSSLKNALEQLGVAPCYHMRDAMEEGGHIALWQAAATLGQGDWATIFQGYQATVDWPGTFFYQALMQQYPAAKVILTVRDPERWYTSTYETIYQDQLHPEMYEEFGWPLALDAMVKAVIWQGTFQGRFADRAYAIDCFQRHNAEVQRIVPAEKLLVYDIKAGWDPLCRFLHVPIPSAAFPHANSTEAYIDVSSL
jgi:hypothetical protein